MNPRRRPLELQTLNDVRRDVELLLRGHETVGNWSLGQICRHLTDSLTGSLEGFPVQAPWILRKTVGPLLLGHVLRTGRIAEGFKLPENLVPPPQPDPEPAARDLLAAIERYQNTPGDLAEHPFGGRIARDTWNRFHAIHCSHHLSFVIPLPGSPGSNRP